MPPDTSPTSNPKEEDYVYSESSQRWIRTVTHIDGVRITVCENRFEIIARIGCEIREQQTVQMFRKWLRKRQEKLRESGDLSE